MQKTKGQISIDYIVAIIAFFFFAIYFLYEVSNVVPRYVQQIEEQRIRSEAYQMSELVMNDAGRPLNWNQVPVNQIVRMGLSESATANKTNLMSAAKAVALNNICATQGHAFVRTMMRTDLQFSLFLVDRTNGTTYMSCSPASTVNRGFSATVKRVGAMDNGNFAELTVQAWRP